MAASLSNLYIVSYRLKGLDSEIFYRIIKILVGPLYIIDDKNHVGQQIKEVVIAESCQP